MVIGIAVLLVLDLALAAKRVQYGRQLARMRASMTETERQRVDAIAASTENDVAVAVELARREAQGDDELHLAVDIQAGLLYLERQGARLREMRVRMGPEATVGTPPDAVLLAARSAGARWRGWWTARTPGRCRPGSTRIAGCRSPPTGW